jgi:hypothetical protein
VTDLEALSPAKRALLERALRQRRAADASGAAIPRRSSPGPVPLSYAQQRMWFLQQWEPDAPTFNGARAIRLRGRLDRGALERGLRTVIERHESLRTVVDGDGAPTQKLLESWSFAVPVLTFAEADLGATLRELSREPFDLTAELLLRATLIELAGDDHVLLIRMHHIAADAHSDSVLFAELTELYNAALSGRAPQLPELPIQYADYAVWQRERLSGSVLSELVSYWTQQLEGAPPLLRLPTDRPRRQVQRHDGSHHEVVLPRALADPLVALGRDEGVTFFMIMLAAFSTLLYRWSGEQDIVIGSPIANRNNLELQGLIGFFTNTIALRTRLAGNPTFREVIGRAKATALGAYAHQDLPFDKVVEVLRPKRDPSYNPLFQVNFRAQATKRPELGLQDLSAEPISIDIGFSRFDLALELELRDEGLSGYFEYDRDLFDTDTVVGFVEDLQALLEQVGSEPDVPVLALALPRGRKSTRTSGARVIGRRLGR